MRIHPLLGSLFILAAGCSSSPPDSGAPDPAAILAFTHVTNLLLTSVDVDGTTGLLGVDTGDPFVLLNPATFPMAPAVGPVGSLVIGATVLTDVQVLTTSESPASPDPAVTLGGLLGCTVICRNVATFDYANGQFGTGPMTPPSGLLPEVTLPFSFKGGGVAQQDGTAVTIPRSRIIVDVDIEGTNHTMLFDTGASQVIVNRSLFMALTKDGRAQLSGGMVSTTSGMSTASFTRAREIALGQARVKDVVVAFDTSFDANLAAASKDALVNVEGSLGGSFLHDFYLTVDYPNEKLHLARYADTSFAYDIAEIVGVALGQRSTSGYPVGKVFAGTDAANKGVEVGDTILSVDGRMLAPLTSSEAALLLGGKPGTTKQVQFGSAAKLANQTVGIEVSELLPLP